VFKVFSVFYLLDNRFWALLVGLRSLRVVLSFLFIIKFSVHFFLLLSLTRLVVVRLLWSKDLVREGLLLGRHSVSVQNALKLGMVWFIVSEVFFFFSFFWSFFHRRLRTTSELGFFWAPVGVEPLNPFQVPLLNTLVLLSSGFTVTWSHHRLQGNLRGRVRLAVTVLLGWYFTLLQAWEYYQARFRLIDRVYGSVFFMTTGFHGIHVIAGSLLLLFMLVRISLSHFSCSHHVGYELAIWYWHFVDVVWLFLFVFVYWWFF
jgi:cytochrome c oxidase subunit 3